ncbi:MAG: excinuclease ABC subunit C [Bacillales bacterium]|nr:excinuclease ABC subunit C [Bacillales bacterium]
MNDKIKEKLKNLPESPGSYQMIDKDGRIIYVGKAKNLKNRVRSYFIGAHNEKTTALVAKIDDINYIETLNEKEAFLLEISLIKKHNPFYNIDLTDDKTYPYIEYTEERNPKLIITRKLSPKNKRYFGPYPNVKEARDVLNLLNTLYKMRKCVTMPRKSCIYYDIGECRAPCIYPITTDEYDEIYKEIRSLLNGTDLSIMKKLKEEMAASSEKMDYENAKKMKDTIDAIKGTIIKQDILLKDKVDVDVFGISYDEDFLSITILYLRGGKIILSNSEVIPYYFDVSDALVDYINAYYKKNLSPQFIYASKEYEDIFSLSAKDSIFFSPIKGTKKNLLYTAKKNSETKLLNKNKTAKDARRKALEDLAELLSLPLLTRIESFDNSNLFGDSPVSSMVVYINGKKSPKEYRKYKIETVKEPNDFETMKEVVLRRYKNAKEDVFSLPDLILADGGIIQVRAIENALLSLKIDNIPVAGLKKDQNHDTSTIIYRDKEYSLDRHSSLYRLLFEIQEEVHRFAITFHRSLKEKNSFISILDNIDGIGETLKDRLLEKYKTIAAIKDANIEELKEIGLKDSAIKKLKEALEGDVSLE